MATTEYSPLPKVADAQNEIRATLDSIYNDVVSLKKSKSKIIWTEQPASIIRSSPGSGKTHIAKEVAIKYAKEHGIRTTFAMPSKRKNGRGNSRWKYERIPIWNTKGSERGEL